jgi:hypothetical protein
MHTASQNGKHRATLERYDSKTRIAVIRPPGWQPDSNPYQFYGAAWIPLWSHFAPPASTKETSL